MSALVTDLCDRGLQDEVLVMALGEFGRTPKINKDAGRDHWPGAIVILYAGGGLKMGQTIGTTNASAEYPTSKPYTPGCVLSTMYHVLGIDHSHVFYDQAQRPLPILSEGRADQGTGGVRQLSVNGERRVDRKSVYQHKTATVLYCT